MAGVIKRTKYSFTVTQSPTIIMEKLIDIIDEKKFGYNLYKELKNLGMNVDFASVLEEIDDSVDEQYDVVSKYLFELIKSLIKLDYGVFYSGESYYGSFPFFFYGFFENLSSSRIKIYRGGQVSGIDGNEGYYVRMIGGKKVPDVLTIDLRGVNDVSNIDWNILNWFVFTKFLIDENTSKDVIKEIQKISIDNYIGVIVYGHPTVSDIDIYGELLWRPENFEKPLSGIIFVDERNLDVVVNNIYLFASAGVDTIIGENDYVIKQLHNYVKDVPITMYGGFEKIGKIIFGNVFSNGPIEIYYYVENNEFIYDNDVFSVEEIRRWYV